MKINIAHIGSNDWFNYKTEIVYGLYHSLVRLGHEVGMSHNQLLPDFHNIIIGADWLTEDAHVQHIKKTKLDFSVFDVEGFDGKTVNQRPSFNIKTYLELLCSSRFIFSPYRYNFKAYANCGLSEKCKYTPWGYYEELIDPNISSRAPKLFDAVFFGLLKGERVEKLNKLAAIPNMRLKAVSNSDPHMMRAYYLSATRYGLSLSAGKNEFFVNPFRIYLMAANGIPVLADNLKDEDNYLQYAIRKDVVDMEGFLAEPGSELSHVKSIVDGYRLVDSFKSIF